MPNDTSKNKPVGIGLGKGRIGYRTKGEAINAFLAENGEDADYEPPVRIEDEESGRAGWHIPPKKRWEGDKWGTQVFFMLIAGNIFNWGKGMLMKNAKGDDIRIRGWQMTRNGKKYRCVIRNATVGIDMLKDGVLEEMNAAGFLKPCVMASSIVENGKKYQCVIHNTMVDIDMLKDGALEEMFAAGFLDSAITPRKKHTPAERETHQKVLENIKRVKSKMVTKLRADNILPPG